MKRRGIFFRLALDDVDPVNHHIFLRLVLLAGGDVGDFLYHVHSFSHCAEYCMAIVEVRNWAFGDKKSEPLVPGPAVAMDKMPGAVVFEAKLIHLESDNLGRPCRCLVGHHLRS